MFNEERDCCLRLANSPAIMDGSSLLYSTLGNARKAGILASYSFETPLLIVPLAHSEK